MGLINKTHADSEVNAVWKTRNLINSIRYLPGGGCSQQSYAESGKSEGQLFDPQTRSPAQSVSK